MSLEFNQAIIIIDSTFDLRQHVAELRIHFLSLCLKMSDRAIAADF